MFSEIRFVRRFDLPRLNVPFEKSVTKLNHAPPDFKLKLFSFDFHHEY